MLTMDCMLPANQRGKGHYLIMPCSFAATIAGLVPNNSAAAAAGSASASAFSSAPAPPSSSQFPFVLSIYSAHPVIVKRRPAYVPALTLSIHLGSMLAECKQLSSDAHLYTLSSQGGYYLVVVNRHYRKYLSITVDCSGSQGVVGSRRGRNGNHLQTADMVPPRHRQLLLVLLAPRSDKGYSFARSCTYMFVPGIASQPHSPPLARGFDIHQPVPIDATALQA